MSTTDALARCTSRCFRSVSNGHIEPSDLHSGASELSSDSDLIDELVPDDKRKMHHSDSLYLMRKKVRGDADDDTSDDESQLSSSEP